MDIKTLKGFHGIYQEALINHKLETKKLHEFNDGFSDLVYR